MAYSILRYPGGKGRFAKILAENIALTDKRVLLEPFAGGASAGLTLLSEGVIDKLILVEKDPRIAAFWKRVEENRGFSEQVANFESSIKEKSSLYTEDTLDLSILKKRRDEVQKQLEDFLQNDIGMWVLVKNRCSFGGYLDEDGLLVRGFGRPSQKPYTYYEGVWSQWNGETLSRKIEEIHGWFKTEKMQIIEGDAFDEIPKHPNTFAFIDPPYTYGKETPGSGLYRENQVDHPKLFRMLADRKSPWLATYNNCEAVINLIQENAFQYTTVKMNRLHADTDQKNREDYKEIIICPRYQKLIGKGDKMIEESVLSVPKKRAKRSDAGIPRKRPVATIPTIFIDIAKRERDRLQEELKKLDAEIARAAE